MPVDNGPGYQQPIDTRQHVIHRQIHVAGWPCSKQAKQLRHEVSVIDIQDGRLTTTNKK